MSDLREILEPLERGPIAPSLPVSEVRRRGDRMRRRRTAYAAVGTAAAVAVLVTGSVLAGGSTPGSSPAPGPATQGVTPSPTVATPPSSASTIVPAGFPLDNGLSQASVDGPPSSTRALTTPFAFDPCGGNPAADAEPRSDFAQVRAHLPGGETVTHQLAVYADPAASHRAFAALGAALDRCPRHDGGNGSEERSAGFGPAVPGTDESLVVVTRSLQDGQRTAPASHYVLVRVGTAIFVLRDDGEFGLTPMGDASVDDNDRAHAAEVISSMCAFSSQPCTTTGTVLTPVGYGDLEIGMSRAEVRDNPEVKSFDTGEAGSCAHGRLVDGGTLAFSPALGLVAIWLGGDMSTPEGITLSSTQAEVRAAYPDGSLRRGYWVVPLGAGVEYEFGFEGDGVRVGEAALTTTEQDCFG